LGCVFILTSSPSIYRIGSLCENTPKHHENALRIQWGDDTWNMEANRLKVGSADLWGRLIPNRLRSHRLLFG
jgi:hypothetical protein